MDQCVPIGMTVSHELVGVGDAHVLDLVVSSVACPAIAAMSRERHGQASATVLQLWNSLSDATYLLARTHSISSGKCSTACPAGYLAYRVVEQSSRDNCCVVLDLYVRKGYRRRGIARRMLRSLTHRQPLSAGSSISDSRSGSWNKVQLHVVKGNDPAVRLYEHEGFLAVAIDEAESCWAERDKQLLECNVHCDAISPTGTAL
jgi:GNAT superfamily N-acetyltransferase